MAFIDGPWDFEDQWPEDEGSSSASVPSQGTPWVPGEPVPDVTLARNAPPKPPPSLAPKTAYTTAHIQFRAPVQPGSTTSDGYDIAVLTERVLKDKIREWLGTPTDVEFEVFVNVDVR